jgi:hypothetical protein
MNGNGAAAVPTLGVGDPAPPLRLPDLSGKIVDVSNLHDRKTLLLFWNPGCGFCQQMLGDLQKWDTKRSLDAPELLVISTGAVAENRDNESARTDLARSKFPGRDIVRSRWHAHGHTP